MLVIALIFILVNLVTDLLYTVLNPRIALRGRMSASSVGASAVAAPGAYSARARGAWPRRLCAPQARSRPAPAIVPLLVLAGRWRRR